jgi:hypothetical protein
MINRIISLGKTNQSTHKLLDILEVTRWDLITSIGDTYQSNRQTQPSRFTRGEISDPVYEAILGLRRVLSMF